MTFLIHGFYTDYTIDIETLDDLYALGKEEYPEQLMIIDWENMTITFKDDFDVQR